MRAISALYIKGRVTVEDVTPGTHTVAQYGHPDRGWAGPTTPSGMHPDYLLRKTSRSF